MRIFIASSKTIGDSEFLFTEALSAIEMFVNAYCVSGPFEFVMVDEAPHSRLYAAAFEWVESRKHVVRSGFEADANAGFIGLWDCADGVVPALWHGAREAGMKALVVALTEVAPELGRRL